MFYHLVGAQAGEVPGAKTVLGAQKTSQQAYVGGVCPKSDRLLASIVRLGVVGNAA